MKKFISLALTAAMVASLVPATAFAKTKDGDTINATVSVVNAWNENKDFKGNVTGSRVPEVQVKVNSVNYQNTDAVKQARFTVRLDNADFTGLEKGDAVEFKSGDTGSGSVAGTNHYSYKRLNEAEIKAILADYFDTGITAGDYLDTFETTVANITTWEGSANNPLTAIAGGQKTDAIDDDWVQALAGYTPIVASKTAQQNADAAFAAYAQATTVNHGLNVSSGNFTAWGYAYRADYNGFGAGWVSPQAAATPTFVPLTDVINWVDTYSTTEGVTAAMKASLNAAKDAFIATGDSDATAWVNKVYNDTVTGGAAKLVLYKEVVTPVGAADGTGVHRDPMPTAVVEDVKDNQVTILVTGLLEVDDIISIDLESTLKNSSKDAVVSVTSSDFTLSNDNADITYVNVDKEAIQLSVRKVVDVAEDEVVALDNKGLKISANVGYFRTGADNKITLKINGGFEFVPACYENGNGGDDWSVETKNDGAPVAAGASVSVTKEEIVVTVDKENINEITIYGIDIKAASAKIDKVATIKATSPGFTASSSVEVAKVVDYIVNLTVDEDEDVPVIYSGVNSKNYGITDDSDHWSLDVTAKESFPGAWSFRKGFNFELPDHVFVTDVEVVSTENLLLSKGGAQPGADEVNEDEVFVAFFNAYQNGSHVNFEFDKRVFDDVDSKLMDDPAEMTFRLQLVADTGFEGDVPLKLTGELVEEQEVTIAKFIKPFEVKAEQNDVIIDYRYTDIPTAITITEAEAGLWDGGKATFRFDLEKSGSTFLAFEDATFEIDSTSGLSIKDDDVKDNQIIFTVDDESDDAAATVTMKNIQLFMNRSIPAGPYDLTLGSTLQDAYLREMLFAPDEIESITNETTYRAAAKPVADAWTSGTVRPSTATADEDSYIDDVDDVMDTVKEAFVNVVTAGRDVDDASFTTKVVVPVGENYIVAGDKQIELDTPAYINAAGYTMLPIRAVATALGINNQNVLWDQPTKTVTILYGQRIITMTQGQKVVYVNGSAIPASAAVENTNSRTFLPMRDLATALGVTDITWDQASRTATLNGNQKATK